MQFLIIEIACGAYIFSKSKDKRVTLFVVDRLSLDRKIFWSQRPNHTIPGEILDAMATMLTDELRDSIWWLPTSFASLALNPTGHCKDTLEFIIHRYMDYVDETVKDAKVIYLDSLKDVTARAERVKVIKFVGFFMHRLFKERRFYKNAHSITPNIATDFDFVEPDVAQQDWERSECKS
ncbi:hypothetical protein PIB30_096468 [Stylosanthes scabra]|uniref:Uncharacterized protein n=1 Tax=Stylosanthes scabra TaxID=79078 RepID=A0ABU6RWJ5_9FABA|nr:hypothetical protein [Stylosanthes scabra]